MINELERLYRQVVEKNERDVEDLSDQINGLKLANRSLADKLGEQSQDKNRVGLGGSERGTFYSK